jgi:hypothetical protein
MQELPTPPRPPWRREALCTRVLFPEEQARMSLGSLRVRQRVRSTGFSPLFGGPGGSGVCPTPPGLIRLRAMAAPNSPWPQRSRGLQPPARAGGWGRRGGKPGWGDRGSLQGMRKRQDRDVPWRGPARAPAPRRGATCQPSEHRWDRIASPPPAARCRRATWRPWVLPQRSDRECSSPSASGRGNTCDPSDARWADIWLAFSEPDPVVGMAWFAFPPPPSRQRRA